MIKLHNNEMNKIEHLFNDIKFYMGKSVLDGLMGEAYTDNLENPTIAYLLVRQYCFINGNSNSVLAKQVLKTLPKTCKRIIAKDDWSNIIESIYNDFEKSKRYSLKKEKDIFNKQKLKEFCENLNSEYEVNAIDERIYKLIKADDEDPKQMKITDDYMNKGIGVCCFRDDEIVGICSSNIIYKDGIEINIRVKEGYKHKGIGTAMASKLILMCLEKGIYPSWDAANLTSLELAKKLGYNYDSEYTIYKINE
ncbi:GNAT family N-acetyltransferase [Thomasclavelia cocleata]|uniref:GNAT family N-acetyltransferase n=1 Tax=Thomasclavelia cocleata TaxID=69824 RepID=UPI00272E650A|nr:GNAT family N-acetyltransferase [Thomasclavelia cocleata]